jgi:hypothetical protein
MPAQIDQQQRKAARGWANEAEIIAAVRAEALVAAPSFGSDN